MSFYVEGVAVLTDDGIWGARFVGVATDDAGVGIFGALSSRPRGANGNLPGGLVAVEAIVLDDTDGAERVQFLYDGRGRLTLLSQDTVTEDVVTFSGELTLRPNPRRPGPGSFKVQIDDVLQSVSQVAPAAERREARAGPGECAGGTSGAAERTTARQAQRENRALRACRPQGRSRSYTPERRVYASSASE